MRPSPHRPTRIGFADARGVGGGRSSRRSTEPARHLQRVLIALAVAIALQPCWLTWSLPRTRSRDSGNA